MPLRRRTLTLQVSNNVACRRLPVATAAGANDRASLVRWRSSAAMVVGSSAIVIQHRCCATGGISGTDDPMPFVRRRQQLEQKAAHHLYVERTRFKFKKPSSVDKQTNSPTDASKAQATLAQPSSPSPAAVGGNSAPMPYYGHGVAPGNRRTPSAFVSNDGMGRIHQHHYSEQPQGQHGDMVRDVSSTPATLDAGREYLDTLVQRDNISRRRERNLRAWVDAAFSSNVTAAMSNMTRDSIAAGEIVLMDGSNGEDVSSGSWPPVIGTMTATMERTQREACGIHVLLQDAVLAGVHGDEQQQSTAELVESPVRRRRTVRQRLRLCDSRDLVARQVVMQPCERNARPVGRVVTAPAMSSRGRHFNNGRVLLAVHRLGVSAWLAIRLIAKAFNTSVANVRMNVHATAPNCSSTTVAEVVGIPPVRGNNNNKSRPRTDQVTRAIRLLNSGQLRLFDDDKTSDCAVRRRVQRRLESLCASLRGPGGNRQFAVSRLPDTDDFAWGNHTGSIVNKRPDVENEGKGENSSKVPSSSQSHWCHYQALLRGGSHSDPSFYRRAVSQFRSVGFINYYGVDKFGLSEVKSFHIRLAVVKGEYLTALLGILAAACEMDPRTREAYLRYRRRGDLQLFVDSIPWAAHLVGVLRLQRLQLDVEQAEHALRLDDAEIYKMELQGENDGSANDAEDAEFTADPRFEPSQRRHRSEHTAGRKGTTKLTFAAAKALTGLQQRRAKAAADLATLQAELQQVQASLRFDSFRAIYESLPVAERLWHATGLNAVLWNISSSLRVKFEPIFEWDAIKMSVSGSVVGGSMGKEEEVEEDLSSADIVDVPVLTAARRPGDGVFHGFTGLCDSLVDIKWEALLGGGDVEAVDVESHMKKTKVEGETDDGEEGSTAVVNSASSSSVGSSLRYVVSSTATGTAVDVNNAAIDAAQLLAASNSASVVTVPPQDGDDGAQQSASSVVQRLQVALPTTPTTQQPGPTADVLRLVADEVGMSVHRLVEATSPATICRISGIAPPASDDNGARAMWWRQLIVNPVASPMLIHDGVGPSAAPPVGGTTANNQGRASSPGTNASVVSGFDYRVLRETRGLFRLRADTAIALLRHKLDVLRTGATWLLPQLDATDRLPSATTATSSGAMYRLRKKVEQLNTANTLMLAASVYIDSRGVLDPSAHDDDGGQTATDEAGSKMLTHLFTGVNGGRKEVRRHTRQQRQHNSTSSGRERHAAGRTNSVAVSFVLPATSYVSVGLWELFETHGALSPAIDVGNVAQNGLFAAAEQQLSLLSQINSPVVDQQAAEEALTSTQHATASKGGGVSSGDGNILGYRPDHILAPPPDDAEMEGSNGEEEDDDF